MSIAEMSSASTGPSGKFPLSANLELFCLFDKGDLEGAFGPKLLVILGWRVSGEIDLDILRGALYDVVARHEILRTSVVRDEEVQYQRINSPVPPELAVIDLPGTDARPREDRAEEFLNEIECGTLSVTELPHIRAVLGRFDTQDAVLVLITHHTASDGWSMHLILRDIATLYASRKGLVLPDLPELRQYREYADWQRAMLAGEKADAARRYWREQLRGAELLAIPMDHAPPSTAAAAYAAHRFLLSRDLTSAALELARALRSSPFMVLLAVFDVLLYKMTGTADVVAATMTSGRGDLRFQDTVGPFFNMVPLRTDLARCGSFRELVLSTRTTCLDAYKQEIPFAQIVAEAPELMRPYAAGNLAVCVFQLFQFPDIIDGQPVGDLKFTEIRRRLQSYPLATDLPNGVLWSLDLLPSGETAGHMKFNTREFDSTTIARMAEDYDEILRRAVAAPDSPLAQICDF